MRKGIIAGVAVALTAAVVAVASPASAATAAPALDSRLCGSTSFAVFDYFATYLYYWEGNVYVNGAIQHHWDETAVYGGFEHDLGEFVVTC